MISKLLMPEGHVELECLCQLLLVHSVSAANISLPFKGYGIFTA